MSRNLEIRLSTYFLKIELIENNLERISAFKLIRKCGEHGLVPNFAGPQLFFKLLGATIISFFETLTFFVPFESLKKSYLTRVGLLCEIIELRFPMGKVLQGLWVYDVAI